MLEVSIRPVNYTSSIHSRWNYGDLMYEVHSEVNSQETNTYSLFKSRMGKGVNIPWSQLQGSSDFMLLLALFSKNT